ncbi:MAG: pyridoxal 5'-phosphate synthase glutaminase subunit PdxT [Clostridia bacterium]|nr:pyridoxal 5'-phosphate synthase glutaminase subunit PdxT [Clostridia bacterium]
MRIGILALQGAFAEHEAMLSGLGATVFEIRQPKDLTKSMDGMVIPGGESTVMGKLLRDLDMLADVQAMIRRGLPTFGTCAGLILLAKRIEGDDIVHLGTMDIVAKRNAYGRQLGSFDTEKPFNGIGNIPMTFIRAPYIVSCGDKAEVLATCDGRIVAARQDNQLVTAFHPELTTDTSVHRFFLEKVCK